MLTISILLLDRDLDQGTAQGIMAMMKCARPVELNYEPCRRKSVRQLFRQGNQSVNRVGMSSARDTQLVELSYRPCHLKIARLLSRPRNQSVGRSGMNADSNWKI